MLSGARSAAATTASRRKPSAAAGLRTRSNPPAAIFFTFWPCAAVEIDSVPYAPECANPLQASGSEENLLNQLLVRNRQVYLDSATNQIHAGKQMI